MADRESTYHRIDYYEMKGWLNNARNEKVPSSSDVMHTPCKVILRLSSLILIYEYENNEGFWSMQELNSICVSIWYEYRKSDSATRIKQERLGTLPHQRFAVGGGNSSGPQMGVLDVSDDSNLYCSRGVYWSNSASPAASSSKHPGFLTCYLGRTHCHRLVQVFW